MSDYILQFRNVCKSYKNIKAVNGVSLDIKKGEFISLLGPSGCGKTTSLRMIAGFEKPTSGKILFKGFDISNVSPNKRPFNIVFQNYALFPHLTVTENIAYGLRIRRVPTKEIKNLVDESLKMVGLTAQNDRYPRQLSGGQQQRVALARALVNKPDVLLLDEPLGALDKKMRKQMQVELKRLHEELGMTFIFVTHDQEEALIMSDRIAVMNEGCLEQVGTGPEIYNRPCSQFVAEFIGDTNLINGTVVTIDNERTYLKLGGMTLFITSPKQQFRQDENLIITLRPEHIRVNPTEFQADNLVQGTVQDRIFMGEKLTLYCDLDDGPTLKVRAADTKMGMNIDRGDRVFLGWQDEDVLVLRN